MQVLQTPKELVHAALTSFIVIKNKLQKKIKKILIKVNFILTISLSKSRNF